MEFGEKLAEKKSKSKKQNYYKSLDLKYIGLEEILELYKKVRRESDHKEEE